MFKGIYGKTIAKFRKAKGLTQAELGKRAGVAQNTISNIENSKIKGGVNAADMVRISEALGEPEVLSSFCHACPVRPYIFKDAGEVDPAEALDEMRLGMESAAALAFDLQGKLSDPSFRNSPEFQKGFAQVRKLTNAVAAKQELLLPGCLAGCGQ